MSSMRNTVQRRNHRERGQPLEREKWGLLEKHKDYSLRARDYGEKRARLKILRQKAAERNPDEFHYGMLNSKTKKGRKLAERGNSSLGQGVIKLLKTQDVGYLQCMLQKTRRAIQRLQDEFVLAKGEGVDVLSEPQNIRRGQHIVLVRDTHGQRQYDRHLTNESEEEQMMQRRYSVNGNDQKHEIKDEEDEAVKQKSHHQVDQEVLAAKNGKMLRKTNQRGQNTQRRKFAALKTRENDLRDALDEVQCQRSRMSNSVGGVTKDGLKWKTRERKS